MQNQEEQELTLDRALWFGKMFRVLSAQTEGEISQQFLKKQSELQNRKPPQFFVLQTGGLVRDVFWGVDLALHGESLMLNTGESPNAAAESRLSQILEETVPQKYYLSALVCKSILNRAKNRGKELPEILRRALEQQAEKGS